MDNHTNNEVISKLLVNGTYKLADIIMTIMSVTKKGRTFEVVFISEDQLHKGTDVLYKVELTPDNDYNYYELTLYVNGQIVGVELVEEQFAISYINLMAKINM